MKCVQDMDIYGCLPEPPRPTNAVRRYDIGYNHDTKYIPLFDPMFNRSPGSVNFRLSLPCGEVTIIYYPRLLHKVANNDYVIVMLLIWLV